MKKLLSLFFTTAITAAIVANPVAAADDSTIPQIHAMNLSAIPLVSRSLSEFRSTESISVDHGKASGAYQEKDNRNRSGSGWIFTSLAEPFYLSLLGAGLLLLGTVKSRRTR